MRVLKALLDQHGHRHRARPRDRELPIGRVVLGVADRVPALHPRHRAHAAVPALARHRRAPEDRAHHRGHRVLQHPDDRRRRAWRAARADRHLVHARRGTHARAPPRHLPARVARHHRRRPHQPRRRVADAGRRRAARRAGRPRVSAGPVTARPPGRPHVRDPHHLRVDRRRQRPRCSARSAQPHGTRGRGHDAVRPRSRRRSS